MATPGPGDVSLAVDDGVGLVTVDNPGARNGLTPELGARLVAVCEEIDGRPEIGAAVVRGAGGTATSSTRRPALARGLGDGARRADVVDAPPLRRGSRMNVARC